MKRINLINVTIPKSQRLKVCRTLRSGMIGQGPRVKQFEEIFAQFTEAKYSVATNSGTSALHTALLALGIKKGDEVITTPFSFIATANAIKMCGAKVVFCDVNSRTFNIDENKIEELITKKTKAILPVHLYGNPANMTIIMDIAKRNKLLVIEDCCQAHGAKIDGKYVGTFGDAGCFSFYPTKNMTTGEGGMIITNNPEVDRRSRMIREHGTERGEYNYEMLGYNFRMTDIGASIGIEQIKTLRCNNFIRRTNAEVYKDTINNRFVKLPVSLEGADPVYNLFTLRIIKGKLKKFIEHMESNGVQAETYYPIPLHMQPFYGGENIFKMWGKTLSTAESLSKSVVSIPVRPDLTSDELEKIIKTVNSFKG